MSEICFSFGAGHPTLPAPDSEGSPTRRPLSTDEMKRWVRMVLESKGHIIGDRGLTSHSCKCTVLTWLAKHGDDWTDRMALGGHVSFMKSTVIQQGRYGPAPSCPGAVAFGHTTELFFAR